MADFRYNKVLLAVIIIGLLASLAIGWQRHAAEVGNSRVELVMDYDDVVELAEMEGVNVDAMMRQVREAGITSLAVYEMSLEKLQKTGKLTVIPGADLIARARTGEQDKQLFSQDGGRIDPAKVYIFADRREHGDEGFFQELRDDLARRLGADRVRMLTATDQRLAMAVATNFDKTMKWNLGMASHELRAVAEHGFGIVARPSNYTKVRPDDVNAVFARLQPFAGQVTGLMFVGDEALGYPDLLPLTARHLTERGYSIYMIEHPVQLQFVRQDGLMALASAVNYRAARTYVIPKDEQPKLSVRQAVQRWELSDRERNIRVDLLRKYDKAEPGLTLRETNLKYISDVRRALEARGFSVGRAGTFAPIFPNALLLAAVIAGATAAGVLFLTLVWPFAPRYQYILLVVIAAALILPVLMGGGMLVRQAVALASAVLFPVLAVTWQLDRWRRRQPHAGSSLGRILADGLGGLVITTLLAMVGGLYLGAVLGDVRFLLEMEIFRGVKATFVAPLILVTVVYVVRFNPLGGEPVDGPDAVIRQLNRVLDYPVQVKTLLLFAAGAAAAWVFIGRSGHTAGVPVPAWEIKLRSFLEQVMYARPREKEFLIGHPAFMLAFMAFYRQWPRLFHYILVMAATIGQGSLVETFAHMRTPILMSAVRGLDGLVVGALFGVVAVIGMQILHYLSFLLGRRPTVNE